MNKAGKTVGTGITLAAVVGTWLAIEPIADRAVAWADNRYIQQQQLDQSLDASEDRQEAKRLDTKIRELRTKKQYRQTEPWEEALLEDLIDQRGRLQ